MIILLEKFHRRLVLPVPSLVLFSETLVSTSLSSCGTDSKSPLARVEPFWNLAEGSLPVTNNTAIVLEMECNAFASLARIQLPSQSRLLASACCPDKDLVALISRFGGQDRLSLWKMQGARKWEIDVGTQQTASEEIVGLAWSPDGESPRF